MRDDRVRGAEGVVVCVVELGDGRIRIVFDDVAVQTSKWPYAWTTEELFTWLECDTATFANASFSERQLADLGLTLVGRLAAIAKTPRR